MSGCQYFTVDSKVIRALTFKVTVTLVLLFSFTWAHVTTSVDDGELNDATLVNESGGGDILQSAVNESKNCINDTAEHIPRIETTQRQEQPKNNFERSPFGPYELQKLALFEATFYHNILNGSVPNDLFKEWRLDYEDSSALAQETAPLAGFRLGSTHSEIVAGHPLLVYRMIRRTLYLLMPIRDKVELNKTAADGAAGVVYALLLQYRMRWPTQQHFNFSMLSVLKIQDVYQLNASDIAKGLIAGFDTGITLRKADAFEIGRFAVEEKLYPLAFEWFQLVYRWDEARQIKGGGYVGKLELQKAVDVLIERHDAGWKQLSGPPGEGIAQMYYFMEPLKTRTKFLNSTQDVALKTKKQYFAEMLKGQLSEDSATTDFYAVCNGENLQTPQVSNSLRCYLKKDRPELKVFPAKVEEINKDPSLLRFYDLCGSKMAAHLKKLSKLTQYTEYYNVSDGSETLDRYEIRQSTASWLDSSSDEKLRHFTRRIESITGLNHYDNKSADPIEVVAYPVGGSVFVHRDAQEDRADEFRGDRISTVFFYIDEPIAGGWTAHPRMGVASPPVFGTGLLWYNLYRNGSVDLRNNHGACPVILGAKWGSNILATEHGNFLTWKCLTQLQ